MGEPVGKRFGQMACNLKDWWISFGGHVYRIRLNKNGTRLNLEFLFRKKFPSRKTGLPFQTFRLFKKNFTGWTSFLLRPPFCCFLLLWIKWSFDVNLGPFKIGQIGAKTTLLTINAYMKRWRGYCVSWLCHRALLLHKYNSQCDASPIHENQERGLLVCRLFDFFSPWESCCSSATWLLVGTVHQRSSKNLSFHQRKEIE